MLFQSVHGTSLAYRQRAQRGRFHGYVPSLSLSWHPHIVPPFPNLGIDITMYETLLRPHEVQQLPPPRPLSQVIDKLKHMEQYREEKRQRQIANAGKRKREEDEPTTTGMEREMQTRSEREMGTGAEGGTEKRARVGTAGESAAPALVLAEKSDERTGSGREIVPPTPPEDATTSAVAGSSQVELPAKLNRSKVSPEVRGHTSYLTFARLVPFPLSPPDPSIPDGDRLVPARAS